MNDDLKWLKSKKVRELLLQYRRRIQFLEEQCERYHVPIYLDEETIDNAEVLNGRKT